MTETTNRRDQNRRATRTAISDASIALVIEHGREAVTVERIAEQAGVSRRTFFNYFSSIDAALNAPTDDLLARVLDEVDTRSRDESLVETVLRVISANVTLDYLQVCLDLDRAIGGHAEYVRYELESWEHAARGFVHALVAQGGHQADGGLRLTVFVASVFGSVRATMTDWLTAVDHPITEADLRELKQLMLSTVEVLRDGFADL